MKSPPLPLWRMPRSRYDQLVEAGIFGPEDRIELLDGLLVAREPQGARHATVVGLVRAALAKAFGGAYHIREEKPIALDEQSEPEPDVVVVPGRLRDYLTAPSLSARAGRRGRRHVARARPAAQGRPVRASGDRRLLGGQSDRRGARGLPGAGARPIGARRLEVRLGPPAPAQRHRDAAGRAPSAHPRRHAATVVVKRGKSPGREQRP